MIELIQIDRPTVYDVPVTMKDVERIWEDFVTLDQIGERMPALMAILRSVHHGLNQVNG
jgi:hypothetical protein